VSRKRPYKITICGFGLIGGSIALDLAHVKPRPKVCACDFANILKGAGRDARFNVQTERNWSSAVDGADIVILSASPKANREMLALASKSSTLTNCLIVDVGSTKRIICSLGQRLSFAMGTQFVGCHPMAGTEKSGYQHAQTELFRGNPWFVDSKVKMTKENKQRLEWLTTQLHARPVLVAAKDHDQIVAMISHLPQLLSTLLAAQLPPKLLKLAGPGLKSLLRLAGSPHALWENIIVENGDEIADALTMYRDNVSKIISLVKKKQSLKPVFDSAVRSYRCLS
jgi:prephenate dehydrogenase